MSNGVSKKLCITAISIGLIMQMANGAEDKLPYAIIIGVAAIVYEAIQGWIDIKK